MRLLLVIALATVLSVAPSAEAGDDLGTPETGSTSTSSEPTTTSSSGPEPSGCRPYCVAS